MSFTRNAHPCGFFETSQVPELQSSICFKCGWTREHHAKHDVCIWLEHCLYAATVDGVRVRSPAGYVLFPKRHMAEEAVDAHVAALTKEEA